MALCPRSSLRTEAGVVLMALTMGKAQGLRCRQATGSKLSPLSSRRCVHTAAYLRLVPPFCTARPPFHATRCCQSETNKI